MISNGIRVFTAELQRKGVEQQTSKRGVRKIYKYLYYKLEYKNIMIPRKPAGRLFPFVAMDDTGEDELISEAGSEWRKWKQILDIWRTL